MPERFRIGCDHRRMALIRPEIANARIKASSAIFSCVFKDLFLALHSRVIRRATSIAARYDSAMHLAQTAPWIQARRRFYP